MLRFIFILILLFVTLSTILFSQEKLSRQDYIDKYAEWAIKEMHTSGVPASITLAQGMLESNNGNSKLASKANNHFGIKCHSSWTGKKFYQDDDEKHECFRKYKTAYESYKDHSNFLKNGKRYAFLFDLKKTDYKGWAKGLSKAGYATNPKYPQLLIKIIEDNKLFEYDTKENNEDLIVNNTVNESPNIKKNPKERKNRKQHLADPDNYTINPFGRKILFNNRIKYIIVKKGDTFYKIAQELELMAGLLYRYNDLGKNATLKAGQILYIQPKRSKAEFGKDQHTVKQGETMYDISQKYGVKMKKLCFKNNLKFGSTVKPGTELWLRKRKPPQKS